jgi:cytochrome c biogenesis protein CcmG/thiol:disulfide interchange protein DsbE
MRFALPLGAFALLVVVLAIGLARDPSLVPSPLIDRPAPDFALATLGAPERVLSRADLGGRPFVLNVWASWCAACADEHALLLDLAERDLIDLIGLNYKDERAAAMAWLARRGDPYRLSLFDPEGRLGLDLGVYGVPETFLIDAGGIIRYKHVGPLDAEVLAREILPRIAELRRG